MKIFKAPEDVIRYKDDLLKSRNLEMPCILVCSGTGCRACGSETIFQLLKDEIIRQNLNNKITIKKTGCHGFCEKGPLLIKKPEGIFYCNISSNDINNIIKTTSQNGIIEDLLYTNPSDGEKVTYEKEIPFYKNQERILLRNNALIDPEYIDDYIFLNGYSALSKVLFEFTQEEVIREIKDSNLRGRGGGGFPTGIKWETCYNERENEKYVIVNCDEGDPGAYMDRSLMEGNPHSVLEGLIIAAYAIGAEKGYFYIREEYPLALYNTAIAITQAEKYGLLGENILGSGFNFTVEIHRGAGAFVSGESSALMSAIEGEVGEPRSKYIHTAQKGIRDKPSCLNNVETLVNVPYIINNGAHWFNSIGTATSKGTKIFSLVGKVNNTGLVEVPMGTSLRDIIYTIGGGILNGKRFKAVQTGGPSGGVIPEIYLDTPIGFDELNRLGSMMGSGGMIVMDEDTCMVDVACYFIDFLCDESCGKCVPCREGLKRMKEILTRITIGRGEDNDIDVLLGLGKVMMNISLCALGKSAANPVISTITYFHDEYIDHIKNKRCPAMVCKSLVSYYIDPRKCRNCKVCVKKCTANAIACDNERNHIINQEKCNRCGTCFAVCPAKFQAVQKISGRTIPQYLLKKVEVMAGERDPG